MSLFVSSRFQNSLQTYHCNLPQAKGRIEFYRNKDDEKFVRSNGLFYLSTSTDGGAYQPCGDGFDAQRLVTRKHLYSKLENYPELMPAFIEAERNWKRAAVTPNASRENVSRFPALPSTIVTLSAEMREAMNFVKENLLREKTLLIPDSTGSVLLNKKVLKSTACGMEMKRCFPTLRAPERGKFDDIFRTPKKVADRRKDGSLKVRTKKEAYNAYYYTMKHRGLHFLELRLFPAVLGYRRQVSEKHKNKLRTMMIPSDDVIIEEGRFVLPFIKAAMKGSNILTFVEHIETAIAPFIESALEVHLHDYGSPVSIDYAAWDTTLSQFLISCACEVFFSHFDLAHIRSVDGEVWPVDPKVTVERLRKLALYIINTPILMPRDDVTGKCYVVRKFGGIPSGCMTTNIIGSICNALVTCIATRRLTMRYPVRLKVQGDDTLLFPPKEIDLDVFSLIAAEFGLVVHPSKCAHYARDGFVTYLGHEFTPVSVSRDPVKTFASLLNVERSVLSFGEAVQRVLSMFSAEHLFAEHRMAGYLYSVFEGMGGRDALLAEDELNALKFARYHYKEYYDGLMSSPEEFIAAKRKLAMTDKPFARCVPPIDDYFRAGYLVAQSGQIIELLT